MPLKKILGYSVFKPRMYVGHNTVVEQTAVKILLEDGSVFPMFSIPNHTAHTLHALDKGPLAHNEFFVLNKLVKAGLEPFGSVRSVAIKAGETQCRLKEKFAVEHTMTLFNKPVVL